MYYAIASFVIMDPLFVKLKPKWPLQGLHLHAYILRVQHPDHNEPSQTTNTSNSLIKVKRQPTPIFKQLTK